MTLAGASTSLTSTINRMATHTHLHIPPWEDQCEWHRMTRMTGPDCAVMCNLINTQTHTYTHYTKNVEINNSPFIAKCVFRASGVSSLNIK